MQFVVVLMVLCSVLYEVLFVSNSMMFIFQSMLSVFVRKHLPSSQCLVC